MNHLNNDHQMLNNSTTPSNSLFDGHMQKYPISPMMNSSFNNARDDSMRTNFEMWKMEMDRKASETCDVNFFSILTFLVLFRSQCLRSNVMMH